MGSLFSAVASVTALPIKMIQGVVLLKGLYGTSMVGDATYWGLDAKIGTKYLKLYMATDATSVVGVQNTSDASTVTMYGAARNDSNHYADASGVAVAVSVILSAPTSAGDIHIKVWVNKTVVADTDVALSTTAPARYGLTGMATASIGGYTHPTDLAAVLDLAAYGAASEAKLLANLAAWGF
jgi:hypothetical protein